MRSRLDWWQARADDVAVALLTAMFVAFVLQITARYVINYPLPWTLELSLTMWLWTVFWGSALCLRNKDHIAFDMIYNHVRPGVRRVFGAISALAIIVAMLASLPATWDWVSFLTIKKSATLRIPLAYVFSLFLLFMLGTIVLYTLRLRKVLRNELDEPQRDAAPEK
ncbi:TRAP transporter small permease [Comamonadaceae bacterium G21597-S1]|nr:TRAP transporter small permease [Comamonadaceae bacterium G21597-S1]